MPHITSGGVRLYFEEHGRGYPVIFLHEFESDYRSWEAQVQYFGRAYRCIAFNARGYPPSDVPDDPGLYGWQRSVADVMAVMQSLSIARAHLVGSSMGGYVALQCGLQYPEKVSSIVAAATGAGSLPSQRDRWAAKTGALARAMTARGMKGMARKMANHRTSLQLKYKDRKAWCRFSSRLEQHSAAGMSHTMARHQAVRPSLYDLRDDLSRMEVPVLLAVGDEDELCLETNLMLKSVLPAAGLWVCANTGHGINLEEPAAFNTHVESFFGAVERVSWRRDYPVKNLAPAENRSVHFLGGVVL